MAHNSPKATSKRRGVGAEEIGTADFDTLAQQLHGTDAAGLSIEPVLEHFQQLPVTETSETWQTSKRGGNGGNGQRKLWAAVAEQDGEADLYVVRPDSQQNTLHRGFGEVKVSNKCFKCN